MGGVNSTPWTASPAGSRSPSNLQIKRRKSIAAEKMYREHYRRKNGVEGRHFLEGFRKHENSEFDNPRKLAFTETKTHKGLRNLAGENNCFLNATIQALWHLGPFRHEMQKLISKNKNIHPENKAYGTEEKKMGLLDALCNLFVLYQYTELSILPPTELRMTLSDLFSQFQLGEIADANETLEAILETIHVECTPTCSHNGYNNCLAHTVFGGLLMEQSACLTCSAKSAPMLRSDYVHYVYAAELISLGQADEKKIDFKMDAKTHADYTQRRFGHLLHECMGVSPRCCPSHDDRTGSSDETSELKSDIYSHEASNKKCDGKANVKLYAVEPPMALAISVGWTQTRESVETLRSFLSLMSYTIKLSDLFDLSKQHAYVDEQAKPQPKKKRGGQSASDSDSGNWKDVSSDVDENLNFNSSDPYSSDAKNASEPTFQYLKTEKVSQGAMKSPSYLFRGFVCYYGLHYISIFQENTHGGEARFLLFDDQKIRPLGGWEEVKKECLKSLYQPVLLLYELQDTSSPRASCAHIDVTSSSHHEPSAPSALRQMFAEVDLATALSLSESHPDDGSAFASPAYRNRNNDLTSRTCSRSRADSPTENHSHIPPMMAVKIFEVRFTTSYITLNYDTTCKRRMVGFEHNLDENGRVVIIGFMRHPDTGKLLPAEACGQIFLMDQLIAVDNTCVEGYTKAAVTKLFADLTKDSSRREVVLHVKSSHNREIWFRCPYCDSEGRVSKDDHKRLGDIRNIIKDDDFYEREVVGGIVLDGENSILILCTSCNLRGSAREMLQHDIFS